MTSQSELIRPAIDKSGEDVGCEGPRGQVMAADDDDDVEWLDIEKIQYPLSDEEFDENAAEYDFRNWKWVSISDCRKEPELQSMGRLFPNVIKSHEYEPEESRVQSRSPRRNANSIIWKAMPTIIQDARSAFGAEGWRIGMSVINMKKIIGQENKLNLMKCRQLASTFVSACRREQGKSIPTMVARDHKTCYTHAFTCPGKSTKEEEYSEQIVRSSARISWSSWATSAWP